MSQLSDLRVKREPLATPKEKENFIADGLGLYLRVTTTSKSWIFRYSYVRHRRKLTLGTYPEMGLKAARDARLAASKILKGGKDPIHTKHVAIQRKLDAPTVAELAEEFYHRGMGEYKNKEDAYDRLKRDTVAVLGDTIAEDVTTAMLMSMVFNKMVDRGSPVAANRTLALTKKMFQYGVAQQYLPANPATAIQARDVGGAERPKKTNLLFSQIKDVLKVLNDESCGATPVTRLALKLVLATAKRPIEAVSIEWGEIDFKRREWVNPWHKIKDAPEGADHLVFLSQYALNILQRLRAMNPNPKASWVLPTPHPKPNQQDHLTRHALSEAVLRLFDAGVFKFKFTPHDLRRTFATRAAEVKIAPHVVEKCLDHVMTGMMATYNHAPYFEERQQAMDTWGAKLQELEDELLQQSQS